jgi:hypothetical protein
LTARLLTPAAALWACFLLTAVTSITIVPAILLVYTIWIPAAINAYSLARRMAVTRACRHGFSRSGRQDRGYIALCFLIFTAVQWAALYVPVYVIIVPAVRAACD